jgi:hypothetical protein
MTVADEALCRLAPTSPRLLSLLRAMSGHLYLLSNHFPPLFENLRKESQCISE